MPLIVRLFWWKLISWQRQSCCYFEWVAQENVSASSYGWLFFPVCSLYISIQDGCEKWRLVGSQVPFLKSTELKLYLEAIWSRQYQLVRFASVRAGPVGTTSGNCCHCAASNCVRSFKYNRPIKVLLIKKPFFSSFFTPRTCIIYFLNSINSTFLLFWTSLVSIHELQTAARHKIFEKEMDSLSLRLRESAK